MAKVIFTITYDIKPEKRDEYLALARDMQSYLTSAKGKNYGIYEQKNKKNSFSEVYVCASEDEFERIEDDQDETTHEMINRLEQYLCSGKMEFATLFGVDR